MRRKVNQTCPRPRGVLRRPSRSLAVGVQWRKILSAGPALCMSAVLSACVAIGPTPTRRAPSPEYPSSRASSERVDPNTVARLQRVMVPLFRGMDHPCRLDQVRVGIIDQNEINAANAGNCEFYVTTGLLRRANDAELRGVLAHELAHEDLGHVAKAQVVGAGLNILAAGLQQLFPGAGVLAPIAGELVARGYSRSEEYAADRHAVDILRRSGYSKEELIDALTWIRDVSDSGGGGFLSTHPAIDDRIETIRRLR